MVPSSSTLGVFAASKTCQSLFRIRGKRKIDLKDWCGNEDDEEALQRGFQGEGGGRGDPWRPDAGGTGTKHVGMIDVLVLPALGITP